MTFTLEDLETVRRALPEIPSRDQAYWEWVESLSFWSLSEVSPFSSFEAFILKNPDLYTKANSDLLWALLDQLNDELEDLLVSLRE